MLFHTRTLAEAYALHGARLRHAGWSWCAWSEAEGQAVLTVPRRSWDIPLRAFDLIGDDPDAPRPWHGLSGALERAALLERVEIGDAVRVVLADCAAPAGRAARCAAPCADQRVHRLTAKTAAGDFRLRPTLREPLQKLHGLPGRAALQRPFQTGSRFSAKARAPSCRSSLP